MSSVVVLGGYGTFGRLVARELAGWGLHVVVAGRDLVKAEVRARELGPAHSAAAVDVTRLDSCLALLHGQTVAANCTGPFSASNPAILEACLAAGCHYADIADDRGWTAHVRSQGERFREKGLAAVYGCSSLPGISGALAIKARTNTRETPVRARVTLLIGNDNPKGQAAIRSLVQTLGQPITAPQGVIRGFGDREVVQLPPPFGRRAVFNVESPEYDLFPDLLGVRSVSVKVGFELRLSTYGFALLAASRLRFGDHMYRFLDWLGRVMPRMGTSGGAVMTELFFADGSTYGGAVVGKQDGQRMAALPCALAVRKLATHQDSGKAGALTAYEYLGTDELLNQLAVAGFEHIMMGNGDPRLSCGGKQDLVAPPGQST